MKKTVNYISEERYNEIFEETFEKCKEIFNSKGCYDADIIFKATRFSVGVALKKCHATVQKEIADESV